MTSEGHTRPAEVTEEVGRTNRTLKSVVVAQNEDVAPFNPRNTHDAQLCSTINPSASFSRCRPSRQGNNLTLADLRALLGRVRGSTRRVGRGPGTCCQHTRRAWCAFSLLLTIFEVKVLAHVHADQGHQLQLTETLSGAGGEGQQVAKVGNLLVDAVPPLFGRALGRFDDPVVVERPTGETEVFRIMDWSTKWAAKWAAKWPKVYFRKRTSVTQRVGSLHLVQMATEVFGVEVADVAFVL